jgi:class 3 adenylate cyclase
MVLDSRVFPLMRGQLDMGSTRRWEADAGAMRAALPAHDDVLRTAIEGHDGFLFKHTGDGVCAAFSSPRSAKLMLSGERPERGIGQARVMRRDVIGLFGSAQVISK